MFKKVTQAYSTLIDQEKRAHYDRFGEEEDQPRPQRRRGHPQEDFDFEDLDHVFRQFFGADMQMNGNGHT